MIYTVILLAGGCVTLETVEQIFYRLAGRVGGRRGKYWARVAPAVVLHLTRMALWYLLLKMLPLGTAVPLLGLNYVAMALAGRFVFGERVDQRRWIGTALVVAGFVMVAGSLQ